MTHLQQQFGLLLPEFAVQVGSWDSSAMTMQTKERGPLLTIEMLKRRGRGLQKEEKRQYLPKTPD